MGDARTGMLERANFTLINVHTVGGDDFSVKDALFFYPWNYRHAILLAHFLHLLFCFGDMYMKWHIKFKRELGAGFENLRWAGIGRVRCY